MDKGAYAGREFAAVDPEAVPRAHAGVDSGTLISLLAANARSHGSAVAMRERDRGIWREFTWKQMLSEVVALAAALDTMGFRAGEGLLVIGDNRPRLYFGMLSAAALRGLAAPIYPDVPAGRAGILRRQQPRALRAGRGPGAGRQAARSQNARPHPRDHHLRRSAGALALHRSRALFPGRSLLERGRKRLASEAGLEADIIIRAKPTDVAVLLHSSGTTGKPKGAPLQHRRVIAAARNAEAAGYFRTGDELMAYLPMAWVGDFVFTLSSGIALRFTANIPERQETVLRDLREAAPTMYFASPRSWDAMLTHIQVRMAELTPLKRRLYDWLMPLAVRAERDRLAGRRPALWRRALLRPWRGPDVCAAARPSGSVARARTSTRRARPSARTRSCSFARSASTSSSSTARPRTAR